MTASSILLAITLAGCGAPASPAASPTSVIVPSDTPAPAPSPTPPALAEGPTAEPSPTPTEQPPTEPAPPATAEPAAPAMAEPAAALEEEATPEEAPSSGAAGFALRFFGSGSGDIDRVKISIDPPVSADVGATDFTLEWWLKASLADNPSGACASGNDNWITGNIIFDRDIWGDGDFGDYGVSLAGGQIAFGVNNGAYGEGICSSTNVADEQWHHLAVTRQVDGLMRLFVDGRPEAEFQGPPGDISYRDGRPTEFANDPFLVFGAEKHDAGAEYPSYNGLLDEVRLSTVIRYDGPFERPTSPFAQDADTAALWHFDEGEGERLDDAGPGANTGQVNVGGPNQGPQWISSDAPF